MRFYNKCLRSAIVRAVCSPGDRSHIGSVFLRSLYWSWLPIQPKISVPVGISASESLSILSNLLPRNTPNQMICTAKNTGLSPNQTSRSPKMSPYSGSLSDPSATRVYTSKNRRDIWNFRQNRCIRCNERAPGLSSQGSNSGGGHGTRTHGAVTPYLISNQAP